jgi:hypothetical protein
MPGALSIESAGEILCISDGVQSPINLLGGASPTRRCPIIPPHHPDKPKGPTASIGVSIRLGLVR